MRRTANFVAAGKSFLIVFFDIFDIFFILFAGVNDTLATGDLSAMVPSMAEVASRCAEAADLRRAQSRPPPRSEEKENEGEIVLYREGEIVLYKNQQEVLFFDIVFF
jgi:hypothetical protein